MNEKDGCEREDYDVPKDTDKHPTLTKNEINTMFEDYFKRRTAEELYIDLETVNAVVTDESCHDFVRTPTNDFSARALIS